MFAKALVPTDLSSASDRVTGCMEALMSMGAEQAVLIHALGIRDSQGRGPIAEVFLGSVSHNVVR